MSQFDDELRRAAERLAAEPMPAGILDEALDEVPDGATPARPARTLVAILAVLTLAGALVAGIGLGRLLPQPDPSDAAAPSSAAVASEPAASQPMAAACGEPPMPALEAAVRVWFPCGGPGGPRMDWVARALPPEAPVGERLEVAIRALLDGPTPDERSRGLVGVVPEGSSDLLRSVVLQEGDGLAVIDFDERLLSINNLSTSAAGGAFLEAVELTGLDLPEVTALELRAGGSCDALFAFFQGACDHLAEPIEPVSDCPIVAPAELPSGRQPTRARRSPGLPMVSWGSGSDTVTEMPGHRDSIGLPTEGTPVLVRGFPGIVRPSGDQPLPPPMEIRWVEDGCPYAIFIRIDGGEAAAVEYAGRIGPPVAEPSPSPAAAP